MREKVRINTFENNSNMGSVVHLGDFEVAIDKTLATTMRRKCCASYEFVNEVVETVTFDGRIFLLSDCSFATAKSPRLEVTLPYPFVPSFIKNRCKACGQKLP